MTDVAMLVAPSARWHEEYGFALAERELATAQSLGCRGALFHGGPLAETSALLARVRETAAHPFFAAAELGGGVGERFPGATALPPLAAIDAGDLHAVRRAARLTAREARAAGLNWAVGPSCVLPDGNAPMVRARTFAGSDVIVGAACAEWIDACQAEGVVAMPGPYPLMRAVHAEAALDGGAGAMLLATAHATDASVISYLRREAAFGGVIVAALSALSDTLGIDEEPLAVQCIAAGCDLLLGADDCASVVRALRKAYADGAFSAEAVRASCARVDERATWADAGRPATAATLDDVLWARRLADASVHVQRGPVPALASPAEIMVVDDNPSRFEPAGRALHDTLGTLGVAVRLVAAPSPGSRAPVVIALFGDVRIGLGFETFSDGAMKRIRETCVQLARSARDVVVVHFTPPEFGDALGEAAPVVCAWSGTRAMEEAAARWLVRGGALIA